MLMFKLSEEKLRAVFAASEEGPCQPTHAMRAVARQRLPRGRTTTSRTAI